MVNFCVSMTSLPWLMPGSRQATAINIATHVVFIVVGWFGSVRDHPLEASRFIFTLYSIEDRRALCEWRYVFRLKTKATRSCLWIPGRTDGKTWSSVRCSFVRRNLGRELLHLLVGALAIRIRDTFMSILARDLGRQLLHMIGARWR